MGSLSPSAFLSMNLFSVLQAVVLGGLIIAIDASDLNETATVSSARDGMLGQEAIGPPFPNDGYLWPTIYDEVDSMLDAALLMYPVAELRKMAKETPEKFKDPEKILKIPTTAMEMEAVLTKNMDILKEYLGEGEAAVVDAALDCIVDRHRNAVGKFRNKISKSHRADLIQFGDDNHDEELVYAIGVDKVYKRMTIAFRGSTTDTDFIKDIQIWMEFINNPLFSSHPKGQSKRLGIHNGFYEYLFEAEGEEQSKYETILDEIIDLMKQYPGYKLYVTGHSLGGALSSLFAFLAATTREDIPKPVTCVSIASPFVGDRKFRKAFQLAEKQGKIRHIRVSNHRDIITLMPWISLRFFPYKHVGINLKLYRARKFAFVYAKVGFGHILNKIRRVWGNSIFSNLSLQYRRNHSPNEYSLRLDTAEEVLDTVYLNDLYKNASFVGDLLLLD